MAQRFEDQYLDVLQNIESAIIDVYRDHPEVTDYNVDKALAGLVRVYQARIKDQPAPHLSFKEVERHVYDAVMDMCDWRLGELKSGRNEGLDALMEELEPKTLDEIVACLKRIRKSVSLWTKQGGRQGYVTFIASSFGE